MARVVVGDPGPGGPGVVTLEAEVACRGTGGRAGGAAEIDQGPGAGRLLAYRPALDGLRAVAVLVVMAEHTSLRVPRGGAPVVPGGFLGVDVFLVISGFLITSLLLVERRRTGRVDLRAFWLRRARRLLPAVGAMAAATVPCMDDRNIWVGGLDDRRNTWPGSTAGPPRWPPATGPAPPWSTGAAALPGRPVRPPDRRRGRP
jgi:hypothetical protein